MRLFLRILVSLLVAALLPTLALGLTVDAGPDKTLPLPATKATLFGHSTGAAVWNPDVQWSQVSGPAPATFSASWALATTVTATTAGSYVFQLSVNDGTGAVTDTMTLTVTAAASQTAFYVDPTYTGGTQTGAAATPWKN